MEQKEFVAEGLNEAGSPPGCSTFPDMAKEEYDPTRKSVEHSRFTIGIMAAGKLFTVDEVKEAIENVTVIAIDPRASTVHWRIADKTGRQLVLSSSTDSPVSMKTNWGIDKLPGFDWQMTNLNNYVNLYPGSAEKQIAGQCDYSPFRFGAAFREFREM